MSGLDIELGAAILDTEALIEGDASCTLSSKRTSNATSDYDSSSYLKHSAMGMSMEVLLCFLLVSTFGESIAAVIAMTLLWVLVRGGMFVAAVLLMSRRLLCATFLLNVLPFLMYFCWLVVDLLEPGGS